MAYPKIEITPDDIFINTAMMTIIREKLGHGEGFSLMIEDASVEKETREIKYRWGTVQREYITLTLSARIEKRPPVIPFTITKSSKHISPTRVIEEEKWTRFSRTFSGVFGHVLTLYPVEGTWSDETIQLQLYAVKQFKMLTYERALDVLKHIEAFREILPFEIWKPPKEPPSDSEYKIKWWKEYVKSLNRVTTSEEVALMPLSVIPYAMYHDVTLVLSELVQAIIPEQLLHRIRNRRDLR